VILLLVNNIVHVQACITRAEIIANAQAWVNQKVPYSQTPQPQYGGYRTDCSGYVSYAWGLPPPGYITETLPQVASPITKAELLPGDIMLLTTEHTCIFDAWTDSTQTSFVEYAEHTFGQDASRDTQLYSYFSNSGFVPYRFNNVCPSPPPCGPSPCSNHGTCANAVCTCDALNTKPLYIYSTCDVASVIGGSSDGGRGYYQASTDGGVFAFGNASFYGSMGGKPMNAPVVAMVVHTKTGYWLMGSDGGLFAFGSAPFLGSMGGKHLNAPMIGMAATPSGGGYWMVGSDGGIFSFGNAPFYGSMGGKPLNAPIVGMAAHPNGTGYWLVGSDGGIFAFGAAGFFGSMGGKHLNAPIVSMSSTINGNGYYLVAMDGGVFSFGDAQFYGGEGGMPLNAPVMTLATTPSGKGYWLFAADGGVFSFGDAPFCGSCAGNPKKCVENTC
jgi:hypothetical protein